MKTFIITLGVIIGLGMFFNYAAQYDVLKACQSKGVTCEITRTVAD